MIALNISTLVSLLGSDFIPDFSEKILILEEMDATINIEERNLNSLKLAGVFENLIGLIFGKPEKYDDKSSKISYEELIKEIIGAREYPVVYNFDCGHTLPSLPIPQKSLVELSVENGVVEFKILENSIYKLLEK